MTLVQFLLIVATCTILGIFGHHVCQFFIEVKTDNTTDSNPKCLVKECTINAQCKWFEECNDKKCVEKDNPFATSPLTTELITSTTANESTSWINNESTASISEQDETELTTTTRSTTEDVTKSTTTAKHTQNTTTKLSTTTDSRMVFP